METVLIVPGLNDSCANHWQSWLESVLPNCVRVMQPDWENADLPSWSEAVRDAAARAAGPVWIVAHSFGCLAAVHASARGDAQIAGALLVAPADPAKFGASFALPKTDLPFRTILIGSENDPWMSIGSARRWARFWGAAFVNAGPAGHINAASGYGAWPEGLRFFKYLQSTAPRGSSVPFDRYI
jgi:predicted alpha/beta hydrolase family esterase